MDTCTHVTELCPGGAAVDECGEADVFGPEAFGDDVPREVLDAAGRDEVRAEFTMSWVAGGGRPEDAAAAFAQRGGAGTG